MGTRIQLFITCIIFLFETMNCFAQEKDSIWTLEKCITYAQKKNIQVQKTYLTNEINKANAEQSKLDKFPTVSSSLIQNYSWDKTRDASGVTHNFSGNSNTNYSLNSGVTVFNGYKLSNNIRQLELNYEVGKFDSQTAKETVLLNVLNAYLQILYAEEQVANSQKQIESTQQQLKLSAERMALGAISKSDYLQVRSQLASEKQTLATNRSTLSIDKVTLMQLMELPVTDHFNVFHPDFGSQIKRLNRLSADSIYKIALAIKPQIKSAELNKKYMELNIKIAQSDFYPKISFNTSVGGNINGNNVNSGQVSSKVVPAVNLTLTIPVYQNGQVKTKVSVAKINSFNAELDAQNVKNQLRKSIEQASVDSSTAEIEYDAGKEQYEAALESYNVAVEKYGQGMINSVDFLIQKTNLITAESKLLQSKYHLLFSYKVLDFYSGIQLTL